MVVVFGKTVEGGAADELAAYTEESHNFIYAAVETDRVFIFNAQSNQPSLG